MGKKMLFKKVIALALALSILAPTNLMYAGAGEGVTEEPGITEATEVITEGTKDPTTASTEASEEPSEESSEESTGESSEEPTEGSSEETTGETTGETDPTEASTGDPQETTAATEDSEPTEESGDSEETSEEPTEESDPEETEPTEESDPTEPVELALYEDGIVASIYEDGTYGQELDTLMKITVSGLLPVDGQVLAYPVFVTLEDLVGIDEDQEVLLAYDITIFDANGNKWQPDETVHVTFSAPELLDVEEVNVYHINEEDGEVTEVGIQTFAAFTVDGHSSETIEVIEPGTFEVEPVAVELEVDQTNLAVTFDADGFSTYVVTVSNYTVKVTVNGVETELLVYGSGNGTADNPRLRDGAFLVTDGEVEVKLGSNYYIIGTPTSSGDEGVVVGTGSGATSYKIDPLTQDTVVTMLIWNGVSGTTRDGYYYKLTLTFVTPIDGGYDGYMPAKIGGEKTATPKTEKTTDGIYEVEVKVRSDPGKQYKYSSTPVPADVIIVLDLSGSMDGVNGHTKHWPNAKLAVEEMIDNLLEGAGNVNTVSLAGYASAGVDENSTTRGKAYNIYQTPTNVASTVKNHLKGTAETTRGNGRITGAGTNSQAGFMAAAELVAKIKETNDADETKRNRQIVVIYVSDGIPTKYYAPNANGVRTEYGDGSTFQVNGKSNTIDASKSLGKNVTVFTVGIGLEASNANAGAIDMMKSCASTYRISGDTEESYFYTATTNASLMLRLSKLGVKLAHTEITYITHDSFELIDPMSEYVELVNQDQIKVQRKTPLELGWTDVDTNDYNIYLETTSDNRTVIRLVVDPYEGESYVYRMVYDVQIKARYGSVILHKDQTEYTGNVPNLDDNGTGLPVISIESGATGLVLNGYTSVSSHLSNEEYIEPQEIPVPVGYRQHPGFGYSVTAVKEWVGPAAASVELELQVETPGGWQKVITENNPVTLTADDDWTHTWMYLPFGKYRVWENTENPAYTRASKTEVTETVRYDPNKDKVPNCNNKTIAINLDDLFFIKEGNVFIIWTPLSLFEEQIKVITKWANSVETSSVDKHIEFVSGYRTVTIGNDTSQRVEIIPPSANDPKFPNGKIIFSGSKAWSLVYFGKYMASEIHTWTNTYRFTELDILKVDADKNPISGVEFSLVSGTFVESVWTPTPDEAPSTWFTSDPGGKIKLMLEAGSYCLTEVGPPVGYKSIEPIYFTIDAYGTVTITDNAGIALTETRDDARVILAIVDNPETTDIDETAPITLEVTNFAFYELPETGGIGTTMFTIIGVAVMAGAAVLMVTFLRKRRKAK